VEVSLTTFQKDLGVVSAEIETLQARSTALNSKLENRKVVEKLLGPAVEDICIAPEVVMIISEGPINQTWVRALEELERRSKAIKDRIQGPGTVHAISNLKPLLDNLTSKVCLSLRVLLVRIFLLIFIRLLNGSVTTSFPKSKACGHQISTLRLYNNKDFLITKPCLFS
jgi:vacuolar protein sorting-associated protein 52